MHLVGILEQKNRSAAALQPTSVSSTFSFVSEKKVLISCCSVTSVILFDVIFVFLIEAPGLGIAGLCIFSQMALHKKLEIFMQI